MKVTKSYIKQLIKEELDNVLSESMFSPTEIFMDFQRQGGRDYWLSKAHGTKMKYSDFMHADQALRAYIDDINPSLIDMSQNVWNQITKLIQDITV